MDLYRDNFQLPTSNSQLGEEEVASLVYHDIFDYPLTLSELIRWKGGKKLSTDNQALTINFKNGFYFLEGKGAVVYKRLLKKRTSVKKLEIAKDAAGILSLIPTIKMVGVTGALSMENSLEDSDIDLMVVASAGAVWTTRIITLIILKFLRIPVRRAGERQEKDKLCLNMWLDEDDLIWRKGRNAYTAHEIAQILPLVNKDETYERFIYKNRWTKEYWPNATRTQRSKVKGQNYNSKFKSFIYYCLVPIALFVEQVAFWFQYQYMKSKITREVVTKTHAFFHPIDWGKVVLDRLGNS